MSKLQTIEIKRGEGKWISFTIKRNGVIYDVSENVFFLGVKKDISQMGYEYSISDSKFDKTDASAGVVRANIPASQTLKMVIGDYVSELKTIITNDKDVDKSQTFIIKIITSVITG